MTDDDPFDNSRYPTASDHVSVTQLQMLKLGISNRIPAELATRVNVDVQHDQLSFITDKLLVTLTRAVAAEELPPVAKTVVLEDPRWATWWDFFKATHRDRWWLAWWVRRRPARTVTTLVSGTVEVRSWWTYPDTPHLVPPDLGYSVLKTTTTYGQ
jgi:hypothetical protein